MNKRLQIIVVTGARPQFIKAAPLCAALTAAGLNVRMLHTGQHFDAGMSDIFFAELNLPAPAWHLACGGGTHGAMTGAMLAGIEEVLLVEKPDMTVVFGDTNSTLAGALAAAKLHIPVAHIEAGLRSGNRLMPEELNRICTDHLSDLLFCSSDTGRELLALEGITRGVHVTGDIMADVFRSAREKVGSSPFPAKPADSPWALLTLHRQENTDSAERLRSILGSLSAWGHPVVFPLHPRTRAVLAQQSLELPRNVRVLDPLSYHQMTAALLACSVVLTDSGGLQKEAYWAARPCITLRDETEWTETLATGWNTLAGADPGVILQALSRGTPTTPRPELYGDSHSAGRITKVMMAALEAGSEPAASATTPA